MTINLVTPKEEDIETVVLFSIDDTDYFVPAMPSAGLVLKYMKEARTNADTASVNFLISLLGEEGYDALAEWPGLTSEILEQIMIAAKELATGGVEDPKDKKSPTTKSNASKK